MCIDDSSFIMNSYPLVAYCISKYLPYKNFTHAITQTVNVGASASSNGALVGSMIGAYVGLQAIPVELIRGLKQSKTILQQIKKFEQTI